MKMNILVAFVFTLGLASFAGAGAGPDGQARRERGRRIAEKLRNGEELTAEEKEMVEKFRAMRGDRKGPQDGPKKAAPPKRAKANALASLRTGTIVYGRSGDLTVRQVAVFQLADMDLAAENTDQAVERLKAVLDATASANARSLAALSLGMIYISKGEKDAAKEYFYQVSGVWSAQARKIVVGPLLVKKKNAEAVKELSIFLKHAKDADVKASIIMSIAQVLAQMGDGDILRAYLEKVPSLITEEEAALAAKNAVADRVLNEKNRRGGPPPGRKGGPRGDRGAGGKFEQRGGGKFEKRGGGKFEKRGGGKFEKRGGDRRKPEKLRNDEEANRPAAQPEAGTEVF